MATTSSWVAHASREPSAGMMTALREWMDDSVRLTSAAPGSCPFLSDPVLAGIVAHVDRALHKRRQRPTFVTARPCGLGPTTGHGLRPMCEVVDTDELGPEDLQVEHTGGISSLAEAMGRATGIERGTYVPVFSEADFMSPELFHLHTSRQLSPRDGGVVIPFMIVAGPSTPDESDDREDLVRATGYASYTFECDWTNFSLDDHARLALLIEDVLDEIVQIKADADAGLLMGPPLWPLVEIRSIG